VTLRAWDPRVARGATWVWLLELQIGDQWLRFSDAPRDEAPSSVPGAGFVRYDGGLDFSGEVQDAIDPFGDSPEDKRVEVTLDAPPGKSWPALVELGLPLAVGRGVLSLWAEGEADLMVFVDGVVLEAEYAGVGEPAIFSLAEELADDAGLFPPALHRVSDTTWGSAADKALGEPYPYIVGAPGGGVVFTSPAPFVDTVADHLLVAAHAVEATNVVVLNESNGNTATVAVQTKLDGLGVRVSYVDITAAGIGIDVDAAYFVSWGGPNGGGMLKPDGVSLLTGFGDVLRWILSFSRKRIDRGRLAAALPTLNAYRMDTVISADPDARFAPWDWIADHVLPLVPISMRAGPDGAYPAVFRWDAVAADAVAHFHATVAGVDEWSDTVTATRASGVSWSPRDSVANELVLSYAHDPIEGGFLRRRILTGDPLRTLADDDATTNLYCHNSRNSYRDVEGQPLTVALEEDSEILWDPATVAAVLGWWARRYALQARLVKYDVAADVAANVEAGDPVLVTDAEMQWRGKLFLVEVVTWTDTGILSLDLRAVEEPPRDFWQ